MLPPLLRAKQTHYFTLVDIDNDGYLTASDWAEIARNLASLRGLKAHTPPYDALMAILGTIWANLSQYATDPTRARVSLDDWLRFEEERVIYCDDDWYDSYVNTIVRGLFAMFDEEARGWISRRDYVDLMMSFWVKPQDAFHAFDYLDIHGDGRLSPEMFINHVLQFHRNMDPNCPSNWFFGPWGDEQKAEVQARFAYDANKMLSRE